MAKRLVDPNYYARKKGAFDIHHEQVLELLDDRLAQRSPDFQDEARAYVDEWRTNQRAGYEGNHPQQIVLAAIVATAIRQSMRP